MVQFKNISTPEVWGNKRFFILKLFLFFISTTFWKNDCSAIQVQTATKKLRLVFNSVMSTGIKNMFGQCGHFFLEFLTSSSQQCSVSCYSYCVYLRLMLYHMSYLCLLEKCWLIWTVSIIYMQRLLPDCCCSSRNHFQWNSWKL